MQLCLAEMKAVSCDDLRSSRPQSTHICVCVGVCTPDPRADASKGSEVNEVEEKCKLKKKKKTMRQLLIRLDSPVELPNGSSCHLKSRTRVQLTFELYTKVIAV